MAYTFLERLHAEHAWLDDKLEKLSQFIDSGKIDDVVTNKYQKSLIHLQRSLMQRYIHVLACRIDRLADSKATLQHMTFGDVIEALKQGCAVRRQGWNGKDMFVVKQIPAHIGADIIPNMQSLPQTAKDILMSREEPHIDYSNQMLIVNRDGRADSWVPSSSDVFATDWEIIEID